MNYDDTVSFLATRKYDDVTINKLSILDLDSDDDLKKCIEIIENYPGNEDVLVGWEIDDKEGVISAVVLEILGDDDEEDEETEDTDEET